MGFVPGGEEDKVAAFHSSWDATSAKADKNEDQMMFSRFYFSKIVLFNNKCFVSDGKWSFSEIVGSIFTSFKEAGLSKYDTFIPHYAGFVQEH